MRLDALDGVFDKVKASDYHAFGVVASRSGETANVIIDGAAAATPCSCLYNCFSGDRVLVMVKGGACVVVGRVSNPSGKWATAYGSKGISLNTTTTADDASSYLKFKNITGDLGGYLELDDSGGVKCNRRGNVMVSTFVNLSTGFTANDIIHLRVTINGSHVLHDYVWRQMATGYGTLFLEGFITVSEGDLIQVRVFNQTAARGATVSTTYGTRLNVAYM